MNIFCASAAISLAILAATGAHASMGPEGRLAPRNECVGVSGLAQLDAGLREAARDRDTDALLALVDENIVLDFGGGSGKSELAQRLTSPEYKLWEELDAALELGCGYSTAENGSRNAAWPWYFNKNLGQGDPFETYAVTGTGVRLRKGSSISSPVIGSVSWDYVTIMDYPSTDATYASVRTRWGQTGYMAAKYLRSEVDYRLVANETDGKWRVTAFVAGD